MDHQDLQLCNKKDDERFQISNVKSNLLSPWKGWDCGQKKSKPPTWNVVARPLTITFGERCVKPVLPSLSLSYSCLWNLKHATSTVFAPRIWKLKNKKDFPPHGARSLLIATAHPYLAPAKPSPQASSALLASLRFVPVREAKAGKGEHERLYNWDRKTSQLILELLNLGRGFLSEKVTTKVKDPRNSTCFWWCWRAFYLALRHLTYTYQKYHGGWPFPAWA